VHNLNAKVFNEYQVPNILSNVLTFVFYFYFLYLIYLYTDNMTTAEMITLKGQANIRKKRTARINSFWEKIFFVFKNNTQDI